jgi:K+-sensing histidine kinase KdpD
MRQLHARRLHQAGPKRKDQVFRSRLRPRPHLVILVLVFIVLVFLLVFIVLVHRPRHHSVFIILAFIVLIFITVVILTAPQRCSIACLVLSTALFDCVDMAGSGTA